MRPTNDSQFLDLRRGSDPQKADIRIQALGMQSYSQLARLPIPLDQVERQRLVGETRDRPMQSRKGLRMV